MSRHRAGRNTPGSTASMGRPQPGMEVVLIDPATDEVGDQGEICLSIDPRPVGLTPGYFGDAANNNEVFRGGYYHTGDIAQRDEDGYISYIGRSDDVFKASAYRLSPFELEIPNSTGAGGDHSAQHVPCTSGA